MRRLEGIKKFVLGAVTVSSTLALAQAGVPTVPAVMFQEIGKKGGVYTLPLGAAPQSFNYFGVIDNNAYTVLNNVFDRLLTLDPVTFKLSPMLAESWEFAPDGLSVTLNLRKGVKWSDGVPFTADDVIFTLEKLANNTGLRANQSATLTVAGKPLRFQKLNDTTLRIIMPVQYGAVLQAMTFSPIMPRHKLEAFDPVGKPVDFAKVWATDADLKDIPGTGSFVMQSYVPGQKITLVRNPNSWRFDPRGTQLPYVDRLEYLIIQGSAAQIAQFRAGSLDTAPITGGDFPDLKRQEVAGAKFKVLKGVGLNSPPYHWTFNYDAKDPDLQKVFRDLRFRQAMQSALNRDRIIDQVFNGLASLPGHGVAPISDWYFDTRKYLGEFDLKAAAASLDAMNLRDTDNDGVRNLSAGKQLEFTLTHAADQQVVVNMATIVQNDLKQIGVKVNLQGIQASTVLATGRAGNFDSIIGTFGDQPDPQLRKDIWQPGGALHYWKRSVQPVKEGGEPNFKLMTGWERRIWQIFADAEKLGDQNKRKALYDEWQVLFAKYMPVILIVKPDVVAAVSNRVGNYFVKDNRIVSGNFTVFEK
jgi:peptide/nickel transport system substrate-binding protein